MADFKILLIGLKAQFLIEIYICNINQRYV